MYHSRKSPRIPYYDYATQNHYFITICSHNHRCIFGQPNKMNALGEIVDAHIQKIPSYYDSIRIDKYVVMPNHIHMILVLSGKENPNISLVIGQFKRGVTKEIREKSPDFFVWQRSFHDHIIRNQAEYDKIWLYIDANPMNWNKDCFCMDSSVYSQQ